MNHDIQAAWATSEVSQRINSDSSTIFADRRAASITAYASRESRVKWPITDGVISIEEVGQDPYAVAVEFKRTNEGLHGVLTALGQAHAYLKKGYKAAIIIIPKKYESHLSPGEHLASVIEYTSPNLPIGVFTYEEPDPTLVSPFKGKLTIVRPIDLSAFTAVAPSGSSVINAKTETQWAHLREGSSDADAFFKYLLTAKLFAISMSNIIDSSFLPSNLRESIEKLSPGCDPIKYLSNSIGDTPQDIIWRTFWFTYILNKDTINLWNNEAGTYIVNETSSKISLPNGKSKLFFVGRSDSIKDTLVGKLNTKEITEEEALQQYAKNIRDRAHSYREDIDSGLEHLGLLENDGRPTLLGYKFVDVCERQGGNANNGIAKLMLGAIILKNGQLGAFLHYIYRLSEEKFSKDPLAFTSTVGTKIIFLQQDYLMWLEGELANNLNVMRKVSARGGKARRPFQAELAILRNFNLVSDFRVSVGLKINWPTVQETLEYSL